MLAALLLVNYVAPQAQAGLITADGVQWELTSTAVPGDSTGTFTLSASMTPGWTGSDTAWLGAFSLKNFGSAVTIGGAINLSGATAGGTWDWINRDISGNGCKANPATADALCIYLSDIIPGSGNVVEGELGGASPNTGGDFSFMFNISAVDPFPELLHLKVIWYEEDCKTTGRDQITTCDGWKKAQSLISDGISYSPDPDPDPDPDPNPVPLPGTLVLLGLGLATLRMTRRRR